MGITTRSRADHSTAQTRELECTKVVLPEVIARGKVWCGSGDCNIVSCTSGLNVVEVAHDIQTQVARHITSDLGLLNSYDTWHGQYITCDSLLCH